MQRTPVIVLIAAVAACGAQKRPVMESSSDTFDDKGKLSVELDKSPSKGGEFTFCPEVPAGNPVNLSNAAWLAFFSANEYAHLYYLAPSLAALGFRGPSDLDYQTCIVDLRVLRGFEQKHADEMKTARRRSPGALLDYLKPYARSEWGDCARAWFDSSGYDGERYPSPELEQHLIQTAHRGHNLQFFSGGAFTMGGKSFEVGTTQVLFARHQSLPIAIVSWRGTEADQWSDVATDAKMWKTDTAEGWGAVHKGFDAAYQSVRELMAAKIAELEGTGVGLWITGHSLGGALATLHAADLLREIAAGKAIELKGVYTFGSPRVGDKAFAAKFGEAAAAARARVVRVRNGDDVVTAVPRVLEYAHVGTLVHLSETAIALPEAEPEFSGMGSVGDHSISGWDPEGKPVSGYYRRLLQGLGGEHDRCAK